MSIILGLGLLIITNPIVKKYDEKKRTDSFGFG